MSPRLAWWFMHASGVLAAANFACVPMEVGNEHFIIASLNIFVGCLCLRDAFRFHRYLEHLRGNNGSR